MPWHGNVRELNDYLINNFFLKKYLPAFSLGPNRKVRWISIFAAIGYTPRNSKATNPETNSAVLVTRFVAVKIGNRSIRRGAAPTAATRDAVCARSRAPIVGQQEA